ncbi:MAG: hypothetical protein IPN76_04155 [Saprospiraceae bacterium]|nr:hypothetical protein [Saprospiraceae bacterium]
MASTFTTLPYKGAGQYGDPVNLGPKINSIGNEETPFTGTECSISVLTGIRPRRLRYFHMSTWNGTARCGASSTTWASAAANSSVDDLYFMLDKRWPSSARQQPPQRGKPVKAHSKTCCKRYLQRDFGRKSRQTWWPAFDAERRRSCSRASLSSSWKCRRNPKGAGHQDLDKYENR